MQQGIPGSVHLVALSIQQNSVSNVVSQGRQFRGMIIIRQGIRFTVTNVDG